MKSSDRWPDLSHLANALEMLGVQVGRPFSGRTLSGDRPLSGKRARSPTASEWAAAVDPSLERSASRSRLRPTEENRWVQKGLEWVYEEKEEEGEGEGEGREVWLMYGVWCVAGACRGARGWAGTCRPRTAASCGRSFNRCITHHTYLCLSRSTHLHVDREI